MKKILFTAVLAASFASADVVLDKATELVVKVPKVTTTVTTNSVVVKAGAKAVWTQIVIDFAPGATQATYHVTSYLQDPITKREIPRSRSVDVLKTEDVVKAAMELGVDFKKTGEDIGQIANKHLETKYAPAK